MVSHYPEYFDQLIEAMVKQGHEVFVLSAVGDNNAGTVAAFGRGPAIRTECAVHEVVFDDRGSRPTRKLASGKELDITVFYDDRDDVCRLLNENGILAMRVTRRDGTS